jgi:hypothetical protein
MLVGYLEVSRAPVSWPIKAKRLAPILRMGASIHQLSQDVLAEKLASPYHQQDASAQSVRRNVPDFKILEATLDAIVVERPSPTDEAPQHLCLDTGYDNEPSRDVLLEHGYIAHIRSIGEEKDEAGQRRYPARRWVMERTLGWLSKCRAILVRYEDERRHRLFHWSHFQSPPHLMLRLPRPGDLGHRAIGFPMPNARREYHRSRKRGARHPLPAMPARNLARTRSPKTCPSLRYPTTLRASRRPQARAASARDLQPPGKRPPFLRRPSSAQTIWIPPRCLNACRL